MSFRVLEINKSFEYNVGSLEYFIKDKLSQTSLKDSTEWIHFAITSEDTNNISYALILSDSLQNVLIPEISKIITELNNLAKKHKDLAVLARTHGQSASPTTFGKEMAVFADRSLFFLNKIADLKLSGKLNGAVGNFNAFVNPSLFAFFFYMV